jgi:hypothetical protein
MDIADGLSKSSASIYKAIKERDPEDQGAAIRAAVKTTAGAAGALTGLLPRQVISTTDAVIRLLRGDEIVEGDSVLEQGVDLGRKLFYGPTALKDMSVEGGVARGILGDKEESYIQYSNMDTEQQQKVDAAIIREQERRVFEMERKYSQQ